MTYLELASRILGELDEEQLKMDVTVRDLEIDEYIPVDNFVIMQDSDILDKGHPVITILEEEYHGK